MNLEAFARAALNAASTTFLQLGEIEPMYHAIAGDGTQHVFVAPCRRHKDLSVSLVRGYLAEIEAVRVAMVTEAWTLETADRDRVAAIEREGVAAQPDRVEVLMVAAEDRDEGGLQVRREIIREGDRARLGDPVIDRFDVSEGRMVGLLPRSGVKGSELH